MRFLNTLILTLIFMLGFATTSYGWCQEGHILIAQIAYDQLSVDKQKKADALAQNIFQMLSEKQKSELTSKYPTTVTFAKLAALPDQWNMSNIETIFLRFNALVPMSLLSSRGESPATWHYIDTPFPQNLGCVLKGDKNVEWAITQLETALTADSVDSARAVEMVFLEHFFGDIHEPLHTVTNVTHSCEGDRGGNDFCLKENQNHKCIKNLHSLWDGALEFLKEEKDLKNVAVELERVFPSSYFKDEMSLPEMSMWKNANLDKMPFIYGTAEYTEPSVSYYENGQDIAKRQIVLAGYRLGKALNELL